MPPSTLPPDLLQAYLDTEYRVSGPPAFTLRIGHASAIVRAEHARHQVTCSAFLTACNPHSQPLAAAANAQRQAALASELTRRGLAFATGVGQHPDNGWPGEASYLVFGLDLDAAKRLAAQLQQNAFVWCGADAVARLIVLS